MYFLDNIVITDIQPPVIVRSEKSRIFEMENRPSFGLSLCESGQITYTMNGKKYISNQNNAVILPQGATYSLYGDKEGIFPVVNFKCENLCCNEITIIPIENPKESIQTFQKLKRLFSYKESSLKIYSAFYELLSKISPAKLQKNKLLETAFEYIDYNLSNPELSNQKIATHISISEVYLRKLFMTHLATTPKQYILDTRIKKAKQLLVDTSCSVSTIAEECGFCSVYHFCRSFKQRTGKTPTLYAEANRIYKI